jgi:serine protease DegQ
MLQRLWLIFAQTATICVATVFVVSTLKPEWLPARGLQATQIATPDGPPITIVQQAAPASSGPRSDSFHDAVKRAQPSVVNIFTSKEMRAARHPLLNDPTFRRFFGEQPGDDSQRATSLGSGVIVSSAGYVITNNHVVETADEIEVALSDGKKLQAKLVGADPETDLAILRVNAKDLPAVTFGTLEGLKVGDAVLAIGNPFGVGQTVTAGIVSALGRSGLGINTFENFVQTDAAINPGNSGGALVDVRGNLVGINTAIYSRSGGSMGIGFAIPVSTVKVVMEQIIRQGSVVRGWIGVEAQEITPALAESFKLKDPRGAVIAGVLRNGPADRGGVRPGDVLLEIEGQQVDGRSLLNIVAALQPGSPAKMKLNRKGEDMELSVTVGRRPKPQAPRE